MNGVRVTLMSHCEKRRIMGVNLGGGGNIAEHAGSFVAEGGASVNRVREKDYIEVEPGQIQEVGKQPERSEKKIG